MNPEREKVSAIPFSRNLALFGTASDVGKSVLATAFCRLLANEGHRVAPFKAQNMSNNAAVAHDGGEIGRAQFVQARAARVIPSVHHNPILLKPTTDKSSQVIVRGQVHSTALARDYFTRNHALRAAAFESLEWLQSRHDVLVLEGAGSCAEVNLRNREFVNFAAAHASRARVVLVADIERGGVFAQIVGSLELLSSEDRARVCGLIVNKFRGDPTLFDDGVTFLEERTGLPVLGVIPYLRTLGIDGEDSLNVPLGFRSRSSQPPLAVICYPHLANFTDFDALGLEEVDVHFIRQFTSLRGYAAVLLPGSKAVANDLEWIRLTGLAEELSQFVAEGGKVLGVCGGLQMLGTKLFDPHRVESQLPEISGLGYLNLTTQLDSTKTVRSCHGWVVGESERAPLPVEGYEIHHGLSLHAYPPLFQLRDDAKSGDTFPDGVRTNQFWGTYLHGLFDAPDFRHAFLRWVFGATAVLNPRHQAAALDASIDEFAEHVRKHIDWPRVVSWLNTSSPIS